LDFFLFLLFLSFFFFFALGSESDESEDSEESEDSSLDSFPCDAAVVDEDAVSACPGEITASCLRSAMTKKNYKYVENKTTGKDFTCFFCLTTLNLGKHFKCLKHKKEG